MLYPKGIYLSAFQRDSSILRDVWETLKNLPPESLTAEGRVYGGGLKKIEPKELGEVVCANRLKPVQGELDLTFA
jgi:hypothetical protein